MIGLTSLAGWQDRLLRSAAADRFCVDGFQQSRNRPAALIVGARFSVDVEATPARTYDEVAATKTMIDRAIEDYDQAIRLNPNFAEAFYNRGVAYDGKGQPDRAIEDYDQAIRLNPN